MKILVWICALGVGWNAHAADPALLRLHELMSGPPRLERALGPQNYADTVARRKKDARLVWLNLDLLRETYRAEFGTEFPFKTVTPELERLILDAYAFSIPREGDDPASYSTEEKIFRADRYGGMGTGGIGSLGSGRAAASGLFQVKGIGATPLANPDADPWHRDGAIDLYAAFLEAFWGEYLHPRLPWGANRALAVIDLNAKINDSPRALLVRQDPLRPAHFMRNKAAAPEQEAARLRANGKILERLLPPARSGEQNLRARLFEWADRVAEQYAFTYAHRLFHGSPSAGNMQLDGGGLDLGSYTSLADYSAVFFNTEPHSFGSGEAETVRDEILVRMARDLKRFAGLTAVSEEEIAARFDEAYARALRKDLLILAGFPGTAEGNADAEALGDLLAKMIREGVSRISVYDKSWEERRSGRYDVPEILRRAAAGKFPADLPRSFKDLYRKVFKKMTDGDQTFAARVAGLVGERPDLGGDVIREDLHRLLKKPRGPADQKRFQKFMESRSEKSAICERLLEPAD